MTRPAKNREEKGDFGRFFQRLGGRSALVKGGTLYLPCPMDPQTALEIEKAADSSTSSGVFQKTEQGPKIVFNQGIPYVETIPWEGLIRHAPLLFPRLTVRVRRRVCRELFGDAKPRPILASTAHLETVIFHVLPRFVRLPPRVKSAERKPVALALWLSKKTGVPDRFLRWARDIRRDERDSGGTNGQESVPSGARDKAGERILGASALQRELEGALERAWRESMRQEQDKFREVVRPYGDWPEAALAFMLYVLTRGSLEVDGFGFFRRSSDGAVVVYKRSGRYALKDYYNRLYLFPDCRVAVTSHDLWPVVLECYKHPLLARHQPWQRICLGHSPGGRSFTVAHIVRSLEDGLNALYYGYDPRKRNGYHRLDHFPGFVGDIHFDDLKIPSDDPRCLSGEIPITNAFS